MVSEIGEGADRPGPTWTRRARSAHALLPLLAHVAVTARIGGRDAVSIVCAAQPRSEWEPALCTVTELMAGQAGIRMNVTSPEEPFDHTSPVGLVYSTTAAGLARALDAVRDADPPTTLRNVLVVFEGPAALIADHWLSQSPGPHHTRSVRLGRRVPADDGRELVVVTVGAPTGRRHRRIANGHGEPHKGCW